MVEAQSFDYLQYLILQYGLLDTELYNHVSLYCQTAGQSPLLPFRTAVWRFVVLFLMKVFSSSRHFPGPGTLRLSLPLG